ncbi:tRNA(Ile)(2)-agmatinylcytidine synthase [Halocatena pleomorpha]|uniref:tRNA(Ile2) 2-agmatinylcytidine synthetase TiaS n=1 Tax=Halocatena pleomorpha TaxID=1785090 RepID=A0A3P3RJY0_9EURY|nr:tRNA(Ile)(2)-agmatinylcytidine synthase [Halocatena pleomorpha]RRJ33150.1 DUF1743 domain-containing protein [Halocatena pleomorpha]
MTIIGIDDTDSRETGMCTTYVAHTVARRFRERERALDRSTPDERSLLVRLNPAVEHKTRGNAAVALSTTLDPETAVPIVSESIDQLAQVDDPNTNPGMVIAPDTAEWSSVDATDAVFAFARAALGERLTISDAERVLDVTGYRSNYWGNGRGRIGALAAIGAWIGRQRALHTDDTTVADRESAGGFTDWTYECISYRDRERWGTPRDVDAESVYRAAEAGYPAVWDTVDREERELVCVPHTPCPILYGVRGDDPDDCVSVAAAIDSEPVATRETFVTNQGTDTHLHDVEHLDAVVDGRAYRVEGSVGSPPETKRGGHVFTTLTDDSGTIECVAFAPTKRFRDYVRALKPGDRITVCGEVSEGTLKLEKFAVRSLRATERVTPTCPDCGRRMESAGREQGYRCRDCGTNAPEKAEREIERDLESGWYEVPPCARRHVAKPLIRGGFDAPIHPER